MIARHHSAVFAAAVLACCYAPLAALKLQRRATTSASTASSTETAGRVSIGLTRKTLRTGLGSGLRAHATGKSRSTELHKTVYFGNLELGSEKQSFSVVFDTGSGNLIIPASDCTSGACDAHKKFELHKSTSLKAVSCDGSTGSSGKPGDTVTITFGTGEVWGNCYEDRICLGHVCHRGSFIAANYESETPFKSFTFDGVLGLSLPVMAQGGDFSMVNRLHDQRVLRQALFSVFLSDSSQEASEISFGEAKTHHMDSALVWAPVGRETGYWEVKISDITFDNKLQGLCADCNVAVDTGTSELAGPRDVIQSLAERLNVRSDCSNYATLPKLGFVVNNHILNLEPSDYVDKSGATGCEVNLMSLDVPPPKGPLFVFGIPFLQKFYTVYDTNTRKIGFAVAKHAGEGIDGPRSSPKTLLVEIESVTSPKVTSPGSLSHDMQESAPVSRKVPANRTPLDQSTKIL